MPLVVMCGIANAGKSVRAEEIRRYLLEKHPSLPPPLLISEETLKFTRSVDYKDSWKEKNTRASFKSEVERWLSKDRVVILDSLNYIKGFRYELFCITKGQSTTHCIVFVDTPLDTAKDFYQHTHGDKFPEHMLEEIAFRFERPNAKNRWDSPLIVVHPQNEVTPTDNADDFSIDDMNELLQHVNMATNSENNNNSNDNNNDDNSNDDVNNSSNNNNIIEEKKEGEGYKYLSIETLEEIDAALFQGKILKPNLSSLPIKLESTNFVFELDRITQLILTAIIDSQNNAIIGDHIAVPETTEKLMLPRVISLSELRRLRRQFLKITQMTPLPVNSIGTAFVTFLNTTLNN